MNTTWRQTIECFRSARPHWTAGTNDLNILSMIHDTNGWGTWRIFYSKKIDKKTNKSISSAVWTSTQNGNALGSQEISPLREGPCKPAQANRKVHWVKSNPWWNLGGTLGGTFRTTFWQLNTHLPQKTRETRSLWPILLLQIFATCVILQQAACHLATRCH